MIYLFLLSVLLIIAFITYVFVTQNEREHIVELLAAKDYTDYKRLNDTEEKPSRKDRKTMFSARDKQDKLLEEQE